AHVCKRAFEDRYPHGHKLRREAQARLDEELQLIDELGLAGFFLLHWDVLELARECALEVRGRDSPRHVLPPGRGRGSSVGSLVCYLTGLSHVDPVGAELSPVQPAAMAGRPMCQWDKDSCADAGFLKIDLLGLGMLSAVEDCVEQIATLRGRPIDLSRIPLDDKAVYDNIQRADTVGDFQ